jgi:alkylation response protein AidB-like acyl-CoA dehydrogenase
MDFSFDETQNDVRKLAASIFERVTPERIKATEAAGDNVDRELWSDLARADLLGIALPAEVGGSGHGVMELCVLLEEMGRRVAPVPLIAALGFAALPITKFATPDQAKRVLAPVSDGSSLLTAALEDLSPTTATKDGSRWRLDGVKINVPIAALADLILVTADAGLFLIDPKASGVHVEDTWSTHRQKQANVTLDGAVVDEDDVLALGDDALRFVGRHALACLCATGVGVLDEAVRITASYISEREQFGKPIAAFQGATLRAADAYIDAEAVRVTTWAAIWKLAAGRDADDALAIAKFWVADGGQRVVHACQHLHGGIGVDIDYPIHRYLLWAKHLELALGGATPQLLKIGASLAN